MGFFDFLKPKNKPEPPSLEEVRFSEIDAWVSIQHDLAYNEIKIFLDDLHEKISKEKDSLKEKIEILKAAELKNQKLPDRAKQAMEGNRETYINKLSAFLDKVDFPSDPEKVEDFHSDFDRDLNNFEKTVARNHAVVEQFFGEKAGAIPASMKKIDKLINEARVKVNGSYLKKVQELQKKIENLNKTLNRKEELRKEIDYASEVLQKVSEKIEDQEKSLNELQNSEIYREFLGFENERAFLEKELSGLETSFQHDFSEIEASLKKYENISQNKILKRYLENPLNALSHDHDLEIVDILKATLTAVKNNEISLKDKKKDKIIRELEKMDLGYFKNFKQKNLSFNGQIKDLTAKMETSDSHRQITSLKQELSSGKIKLKEKKLDLHEKKMDFDKIDPDELKNALQKDINETLSKSRIKII